MTETMFEILTGILLLAGAAFTLVSAIGVYRLPDALIRMHATSKAGTLGCGLILLAVAVFFREGDLVARSLVSILFLLITVPVSAHMIGRAAYAMGCRLWQGTVVDELSADLGRRRHPPREQGPALRKLRSGSRRIRRCGRLPTRWCALVSVR